MPLEMTIKITMGKARMSNPLFSIITVTLNHLDGLTKTHKSLKQQNCTKHEWIVIDGASTDSTQSYLKNSNAHWISEKDRGIYDAMNKGIERAQGDYLIFMNAGDCFANKNTLNILEKEIEEQDDPDFIYGDALEIINDKRVLKKSRPHSKITQGMFTHHQAMVYRRNTLEGEIYDTSYTIAADYDFTRNILKNTSNISYLPHSICLFESGGISQQNVLQGRKEQFLIRHKSGVHILKNASVFMAQSLVYTLRKTVPWLYWRLKRH